MQTTLRATGPLPADAAWERYADLDRWTHWAPQISGVSAEQRRLRTGLRGTVRAAGVVHVPFEVLAVDEAARTWSWRVRLGPIRLHLEHGVDDPAPDDAPRVGARTWLRTTGPAPVVLPYAPLALIALHSLLLER
ncbi:polyketide cyclase/dehydrase/lipid transport protein [Actinomycetospora succinea]|uniref:Polyketide cyclase/dehydrase/lipid transport protein n=1 Tax=Actinomycetospora succinea TaxID=663603 RepID=A0A4R6VIA4_9PSEU|nr:SRPBCC family protein [Actinomycetospora succinea]TDQ61084.1 polyketide cyclase/dehydrase/lipid transport protein [Actinomycetospora succinea]